MRDWLLGVIMKSISVANPIVRWIVSIIIDYGIAVVKQWLEQREARQRADKALREYEDAINQGSDPETRKKRRDAYEKAINSVG